MSVVIDEVVGSVEPENRHERDEAQSEPSQKETDLSKLRYELRRLAQREARLRAD